MRVADCSIIRQGQDIDQFAKLDVPNTLEELNFAIQQTNANTARGLDGVFLGDIKNMNNPVQFGDYRPIYVMPFVVRLLHRILVKRFVVVKNSRISGRI